MIEADPGGRVAAQADRLPRISIVVPNRDGAATLPAALDSILDQGYPDLEVLVADGGSRDGSLDVIQRYAERLAWWTSEPDRGQAHAINRGFARATGEVVNWLCSDDRLAAGALRTVGEAFAADPGLDVLVGRCRTVDLRLDLHAGGRRIELGASPERLELMPCVNPVPQPSCFYRRRLLTREPPLREDLHYVMDFELWNDLRRRGARWGFTDAVLSEYVKSGADKTSTGGQRIAREMDRVYQEYTTERVPLCELHRLLGYPVGRLRGRAPGRLRGITTWPLRLALEEGLGLVYGRRRVRAMRWRWSL
jgi:GT2 family glycosyltransferase